MHDAPEVCLATVFEDAAPDPALAGDEDNAIAGIDSQPFFG